MVTSERANAVLVTSVRVAGHCADTDPDGGAHLSKVLGTLHYDLHAWSTRYAYSLPPMWTPRLEQTARAYHVGANVDRMVAATRLQKVWTFDDVGLGTPESKLSTTPGLWLLLFL
jgi:hypothetical protein